MNTPMMTMPLVGILVNVVLVVMVNGRISQLENRVHIGHDMLIGKVWAKLILG